MKTKRKATPPKFQIFSIFGQCEAAAANHFIEHHGATRIAFKRIPEDVRYNNKGFAARFAVMIPGPHVKAFNKMCEDLTA